MTWFLVGYLFGLVTRRLYRSWPILRINKWDTVERRQMLAKMGEL